MDRIYRFETYSDVYVNKIHEIFNYYISESFAAFPDEQITIDEARQMMNCDLDLPKYVAICENDVVGFAFAYRYHTARVFERVTKFTYFILPGHTRKGIGKSFIDKLEHDCKTLNIDSILVHISSLNQPSINFHRKNGFKECGRFVKIGRKLDKEFDDVWMQKSI